MVTQIPSIEMLRRLRNAGFGQENQAPQSSRSNETSQSSSADDGYRPTPADICIVRLMITRAIKLPPDLVDAIFDHAEYWAHSSNEIDFELEHKSPLKIVGSSPVEDKFLLRSFPVGLTGIKGKKDLSEELAYDLNEAKPQPLNKEHDASYFTSLADYPTPKLIHPVRKIVFSIRSKDQGWVTNARHKGTFTGAWTWFEAGLERFDAEQDCDPHCTYDVRYKSTSSTASPLPVCALRTIQPGIEKDEEEEKYKYTHPLYPQAKWTIQRNRAGTRQWSNHQVTWSHLDNINPESDEGQKLDEELGRGRETGDGSFIRDLKMGDVITVWGKARFRQWYNNVEKVKIEVFWAV